MKALLSLLVLAVLATPAQDVRNSSRAGYRLELKIRDSDDQRASASRNYTFVLDDGMPGQIRADKKVAIGDRGYYDIGMNIDARVQERATDGVVLVDIDLEISSLEGSSIHQLKWKGVSRVSPGKPAVVASLQDPVLQKRLDLEITATRLP